MRMSSLHLGEHHYGGPQAAGRPRDSLPRPPEEVSPYCLREILYLTLKFWIPYLPSDQNLHLLSPIHQFGY